MTTSLCISNNSTFDFLSELLVSSLIIFLSQWYWLKLYQCGSRRRNSILVLCKSCSAPVSSIFKHSSNLIKPHQLNRNQKILRCMSAMHVLVKKHEEPFFSLFFNGSCALKAHLALTEYYSKIFGVAQRYKIIFCFVFVFI